MCCFFYTLAARTQSDKNLTLLLLTFSHRPSLLAHFDLGSCGDQEIQNGVIGATKRGVAARFHTAKYTPLHSSLVIFFYGFNALMLLSLSRPDSFPSPLLYGPHPSRLRALTGLPKDITRASLETCRHPPPPPLFAAKINCSPSRCFVSSSVSLAGNLTASLTLSSPPAF